MVKKFFIAIVLITAVVLFVNKYQVNNPVPTKLQNDSLSNNTSPTPLPLNKDWNTYRSFRFGYAFSYPDNWYPQFFDEENDEILFGTHSVTNYDMSEVEKYMDHGEVDWKAFLGENPALKFDLSAQNLEGQTKDEFMKKNFEDAALQPESDLKFGSFTTTEYITPSGVGDQLIRTYVTLLSDTTILWVNVYYYNLKDGDSIQETKDWSELKEIFQSFRIYEKEGSL